MYFWGVIKIALKLDIWDINYLYSKPKSFERILLKDASGLPRRGFILRFLYFFWSLLINLRYINEGKKEVIKQGSLLFIAITKNQRDSIISIYRKVKNAYLVGSFGDISINYVLAIAYLFSLPFFPIIIVKFIRSKGLLREAFHFYFDKNWLIYGYYIAMRKWLHSIVPGVLVLANDHTWNMRTLLLSAKDEKVPTIYLQHASVTDEFPPLSMDYALLEGYDALSIYEEAGESQTKVFLIGIPRADQHLKYINLRETVSTVGICSNMFDPVQRVTELCKIIHRNLPDLRLVLRPHPGDKRMEFWRDFACEYQLDFSDSRQIAAFNFLKEVDVVLAGNSNIHLEAAMLNVYPIYYDYALDQRLQKYTFIKTNLCEYIKKPEDAIKRIIMLKSERPLIREKAKYYCATIGTAFDGKSRELAIEIIHQVSIGGDINLKHWRKIPNLTLEAYEPVEMKSIN
jgi:hypothetical protein